MADEVDPTQRSSNPAQSLSEPLTQPTDDYEKPLELLQERIRRSYDSLTRIETKSTALFAGAIAILGLTISRDSAPIDILIALLYLVPIWFLMRALGVREYSIVPDAHELRSAWPFYPRATIVAVFEASVIAAEELATNISLKAKCLTVAIRWLFALTLVLVLARGTESVLHGAKAIPPRPYNYLIGIAASS